MSGKVLKAVDTLGLVEGGPAEAAAIETSDRRATKPNWVGRVGLWLADKTGRASRPACDLFPNGCGFAASVITGPAYWQQRLLDHYIDQGGRKLNLTLGDSRDWVKHLAAHSRQGVFSAFFHPSLERKSYEVQQEMLRSGDAQRQFRFKGAHSAGFDGPGVFTIHWDVRVTVTQDKHGNFDYKYAGTMRMTDRWDFDPQEYGKRNAWAEFKTRLGQGVSGTVFDIDSGTLRVHGTYGASVEIDGVAENLAGEPKTTSEQAEGK